MFDRLKKEIPKFRHRIIAVEGDCTLPGLGLSPVDRELLLREISIIFHVAATVRFDEKLKQAVAINISGTKEILELSRCMRSLKAVIHVSTAYSNCNLREIDEKFYSPPITGDNIIRLVQSLNEEKLDAITPALLGNFPNTYTYTKCTAEQVIQQYGKDLPVGIFRPAIVISSYAEPIEGWVDNISGATGALVGAGAGLIRTLNIDPDCTAELVPVDYSVNALIATAWDVANNKNNEANPPIYNYYSSSSENVTWGQYINLAMKYGKTMPSLRSMWCYSVTVAKNYYVYYILSVLLHVLPALIIDIGLFLTGHKTRMLKIYKKIHKYSMVTTYFSTNKWIFKNNNTRTLWETLNDEDRNIFFFSMDHFDWEDYMKKCVAGLRQYIFKDDLSTVPAAKKRMARLLIYHRIIKYTSIGLFVWFIYSVIALLPLINSISVFSMSVSESVTVR
ncbi:fatty acyl-CoA reductase wat isoform X2 [Cephus cinctus]|nr:fatty acyl-CoA reductase wat isoform X2 [Cephus cinctus]